MTNEQKSWLDSHPEYEIAGNGGATQGGQALPGSGHEAMLVLTPDGATERRKIGQPGDILVGKRKKPPDIGGGTFGGGQAA